MRVNIFFANTLKKILIKKKIAAMNELKAALGTNVTMTVFRKLRELSYRTSYSHRGKYYTLDEMIEFDRMGLWSFNSVWFSIYGTLIETAKTFINISEAGYSTRELEDILHTEVKEPLLSLYRGEQIYRSKMSGRYVYFSIDPKFQKAQYLCRKRHDLDSDIKPDGSGSEILANELNAAIILFFALLDEKKRRLYAGLESIKIGYGGDKKIAALLGIDPHTVAMGRSELLRRDFEQNMIRKKGGGDISIEKKP